ncbi:MAG TPA: xanthine dehydrogenase small subunit, partial [Ideonella sp.]|nr:xanthine dehydrogenase small subunit [Ideonella sp.]
GTKEGCAEGDCGACTVVVGELANGRPVPGETRVGELRLATVNACIQFLPALDGKALFSVEDLKRIGGGELHPVQRALVDCHGSQCGFCTPGFAMSLWDSYERHRTRGTRPTRQQLADDLSGNLCRCTGYRPILDAGERMFDLPPATFDAAPVVAALRELQAEAPLHYAAQGGRWHAPRSVDDLAALRLERPQARLLAGSTDIGLWVTKQLRDLPELIYLGEVAELKRIEEHAGGGLRIGAGASLENAWRALVARWPALRDVWLRFASPPIRHAGTMGANVANGSPIGDSAPVLIALDAAIVLRRGGRVRSMALADFYVDYMKNRLEPGEFVLAIEVPPPAAGEQLRAYKVSKRFDSDISAVCAGLAVALDDAGRVATARFAYGGMAAIVRRAAHAEAAVLGRRWDEAALRAAQDALALDFEPLTDMRASAAYRLQVAGNLLERLWLETRRDAPLAEAEVNVWARILAPALSPGVEGVNPGDRR